MYIRPFDFNMATTVNIAVTGTTQALAVNASPIGIRSIRLANIGTQTVFVLLGHDNTITVTAATGIPLMANTAETFLIRPDQSHVAVIAAATGSTLYATIGEGA